MYFCIYETTYTTGCNIFEIKHHNGTCILMTLLCAVTFIVSRHHFYEYT